MLALVSPARACSCRASTAADIIRGAAAIFEARVLEVREIEPHAIGLRATVEPISVWKGRVPSPAVLASPTASSLCGVFERRPVIGETLLVVAERQSGDGSFIVGLCSIGVVWPDRSRGRALTAIETELRRLDRAVDSAPGSLAPLLDRARFRESWDPEGAAIAYRRIAGDHPDLAVAQLGLGRSLLGSGKVQDAVPALQRAMSLTPPDPEAAGLLAQARFRLGDAGALDGLWQFQGMETGALDLTGRDLTHANFTNARIGRLVATRADLRGAAFRDAAFGFPRWSEGYPRSALAGADLRNADFTRAQAQATDFRAANLDGAVMSQADFAETNLVGASLRRVIGDGVSFRSADLSGARLTGANLPGAIFSNALLNDADLRDAQLQDARIVNADLRGADLRGVALAGADLTNSFHDCRTRFPRGFDPAAQGMITHPQGCRPRQ